MKLIIDIPEEEYKMRMLWAKSDNLCSPDTMLIANGVPCVERSQVEWIPVSEGRFPDDETEVLLQYGQSLMVGYHIFDHTLYPFGYEDENETGWYDSKDDFICGSDEVIAWMPLPEPYKEN